MKCPKCNSETGYTYRCYQIAEDRYYCSDCGYTKKEDEE